MGDHQIPAKAEHLFNRLLQVPSGISLTLKEVTAVGVVTVTTESVTHSAAVLAGD
jgi:hypothetical protein